MVQFTVSTFKTFEIRYYWHLLVQMLWKFVKIWITKSSDAKQCMFFLNFCKQRIQHFIWFVLVSIVFVYSFVELISSIMVFWNIIDIGCDAFSLFTFTCLKQSKRRYIDILIGFAELKLCKAETSMLIKNWMQIVITLFNCLDFYIILKLGFVAFNRCNWW